MRMYFNCYPKEHLHLGRFFIAFLPISQFFPSNLSLHLQMGCFSTISHFPLPLQLKAEHLSKIISIKNFFKKCKFNYGFMKYMLSEKYC